MKEQVDKGLDRLVDKMMSHVDVESPSLDFTEDVMSQINSMSKNRVTTYKPLISKRVWFVFGSIASLVLIYFLIGEPSKELKWLNVLDFSSVTKIKLLEVTSNFSMSNSMTYALIILGLMICIQVPLLKHYFNKRLSI